MNNLSAKTTPDDSDKPDQHDQSATPVAVQPDPVIESKVAVSQRLINFFELISFTWFIPFIRLARGEDPRRQFKEIWLMIGTPIAAFIIFLMLWDWSAAKVETSLGAIPGPAAVWQETRNLIDEHYREQEKKAAFFQRQEVRNAKKLADRNLFGKVHHFCCQ